MGKGASRLEIITQQNELLKEQNDLLREQNELLQRSSSGSRYGDYGIFVDNIERDEMRNGILVTSHRKKLWNVQLNLIKEFDRICKKHNLRWFAGYGTLLGAVRHKGYIPWDDDVDVVMLRPEYEKFRRIVASEIKPPYHLDIWYNYRREDDEPSDLTDMSLPLLSREYFQKYYPICFPFFPLIKIRDTRTFMLEFVGESSFNQGIWIDIFPFDVLPSFAQENEKVNFEIARVIYAATINPDLIRDAMQKNQRLLVDYDSLQKFIKLPYKQRALRLENLLAKHFFQAEHVGEIRDFCIEQRRRFYQLKDFNDVVYLPFEKIELPAPVGYDSVLTDFYGDWRKPVFTYNHAKFYSAEIPWEEYKQKTAFK